jgi:hypothetical protein
VKSDKEWYGPSVGVSEVVGPWGATALPQVALRRSFIRLHQVAEAPPAVVWCPLGRQPLHHHHRPRTVSSPLLRLRA